MIVAINKNKKDKKARAILSRMMFRIERDVFMWHSESLIEDILLYLSLNNFAERSIVIVKKAAKPGIIPIIIVIGEDSARGSEQQIGLKFNIRSRNKNPI